MGWITLKANRLREVLNQLKSISDIIDRGNLSPGKLDSLAKQLKIKKSEAQTILNQVLYGDRIYLLNINIKDTGQRLSIPFNRPLDDNDITNFLNMFNLAWGIEAEFISISNWSLYPYTMGVNSKFNEKDNSIQEIKQ